MHTQLGRWAVFMLLLVWAVQVQAQVPRPTREDSIAVKKMLDSLSAFKLLLAVPRPYALRVGTDVSYFLNGVFAAPFGAESLSDNLQRFYSSVQRAEVSAELVFNDNLYALAADVGYASVTRSSANPRQTAFQYRNTGSYFRLGFDYNFFQKTFDDQAVNLGFRYGRTTFSHDLIAERISPAWGYVFDPSKNFPDDYEQTVPNERLSAGWIEIVTGLRVRIWRGIVGGYTFRVKTMLNVKGENRLLANELPGFGAVRGALKISFNYHLYYQIPLKKKRGLGKISQ